MSRKCLGSVSEVSRLEQPGRAVRCARRRRLHVPRRVGSPVVPFVQRPLADCAGAYVLSTATSGREGGSMQSAHSAACRRGAASAVDTVLHV